MGWGMPVVPRSVSINVSYQNITRIYMVYGWESKWFLRYKVFFEVNEWGIPRGTQGLCQ